MIIISSSLALQESFRMFGSSWFLYRSLHCFALRPDKTVSMMDHLFNPCFATNSNMISSSSCVHELLCRRKSVWRDLFAIRIPNKQSRLLRLVLDEDCPIDFDLQLYISSKFNAPEKNATGVVKN
jgi:hypothetical protein